MKTKRHVVERTSTRAKVWSSVVSTAAGVIASAVGALISATDLINIVRQVPIVLVASVGAVMVSAGFTYMLTSRERQPSKSARLGEELATAYLNALDKSVLNPTLRKAHE